MYRIAALNVFEAPGLGQEPAIADTASIRDCLLGRYTQIQDFTDMAETELGDYSYVCRFSGIIYSWIGKFSNISDFVRINPGSHPVERPSLHHFTYRSNWYGFTDEPEASFFNWRRIQKVIIGHDTWIGHGAVIMPGVEIGNGAVAAALEKTAWWDWSHETLKQRLEAFRDLRFFLEKYA